MTLNGEMMTDAMREAAREMARRHFHAADEAAKRLLSRWVSGLEPSLAMDQDYRVIGLSYGDEIVLREE